PGAVPSEIYVTVRPVDLRETGLAERNKLAVIGPVLEIKPSMTFPEGSRPRVRMRLTRASLGATPVSAVQLYKPDGDALAPLSNPLYAFFAGGVSVCAENPIGECAAIWDEVMISGETSSFSHFVALDGRVLDQRPLSISVDPAESENPDRAVAVHGRTVAEADIWYDDDPLFDEAEDATPPSLLALRDAADAGDGFTAALTLPARGPGRLIAVPRIANGKTASKDVRWYEALKVRALGPELAVVNGYRQPVQLACEINQPGELRLAVAMAGGEEEYSWEVTPSSRGINVVELAPQYGDRLQEGTGTSRWRFQGLHGAEYQVAGPRFLVDRTPPALLNTQTLSASEAGDGIRLAAALESRDRTALERIHLLARLGETILFDGEIPAARTVEKSFLMDGTQLAACRGCMASLRWTVTDIAGNQSRQDWASRPLASRGTLVFRVKGSLISAPVSNFPLPVRLGKGGAPFDFAGMRDDGSELRALLPNGQPIHLEVETFRPAAGEAIVWVTLPELKPGKDAYFTLTLGHSETYGFRSAPVDWDAAAIWHLDLESPAYDATGSGFALNPKGWRSAPGALGEARTGDGFREAMMTMAPVGDLASGDITFGAWYRDAALGTREHPDAFFLAQAEGDPARRASFREADGRLILERGNSTVSVAAAGLHDGGWHHVAFTYAPSQSHRVRFYLDGRLLSSSSWPDASGLLDAETSLLLGNRADVGEAGSETILDEIRLAWVERSTEWIRLEHATQKPGAALVEPMDALPPDSPQPTSAYTVSMRETAGANNASQPQLQVRNNSLTPLSGFTLRLWLSRQEQFSQMIEAEAYWFNPSGVRISIAAHPQNPNLVSVDLAYPEDYVLPAGTSTDIEGAKFGIHFAGHYPGIWDRSNDWSWQGIDADWRETPFVALLDGTGAVLAGQEPTPNAAPLPPVESTEAIFGFEALSDWTVNGSAASLSPIEKTEGEAGLKLAGSGYITVKSRDFNTALLDPAAKRVSVDVKLPQAPVNPWWKGSVTLYIDCPSGDQWSNYQGQIELSDKPDGVFSSLVFPLTPQVQALLSQGKRDFSLRIVVNSSSPSVVLDRIQARP
nr:LamG domain-containing protein [Fibrobacterota bacterium]